MTPEEREDHLNAYQLARSLELFGKPKFYQEGAAEDDPAIPRPVSSVGSMHVSISGAEGWAMLNAAQRSELVELASRMSFPDYRAEIRWSDHADARPLHDLRRVSLVSRGKAMRLDRGAVARMNQGTFNDLAANRNPADLAGRCEHESVLCRDVASLNEMLARDGLPKFAIDDGYKVVGGSVIPDILDGVVIVEWRCPENAPPGPGTVTMHV